MKIAFIVFLFGSILFGMIGLLSLIEEELNKPPTRREFILFEWTGDELWEVM